MCRFALVMTGIVLAALASPVPARSGSRFESAPSMAGAQLAPPALLHGTGYKVVEPIRIDRFLAGFELQSRFGSFRGLGIEMLAERVSELRAIEELKKVEGSASFADAIAKSAAAPVKFVGSLATDPGATVENVAVGAGTVLGRVGYSIKSGVQGVGDSIASPSKATNGHGAAAAGSAEPPSFTSDPFGYNQARREWAKKLEIDPYTTNPVLRPLLDKVATATFAGNFAVGLAVGAVAAPLRYASELDSTVRDAIWSKPPGDLAKANEERLQAMGVPANDIRAFLRNRWFTPTLQTALVATLVSIEGATGRDAVVRTAATVAGEVPARFLLRSLALLAAYHQRDGRIVDLRMRGIVPYGHAKDGTLVAAAAVDYLYWNQEAAAFGGASELKGKNRSLLLAGQSSRRAEIEFSHLGWKVKAGLRQVRN